MDRRSRLTFEKPIKQENKMSKGKKDRGSRASGEAGASQPKAERKPMGSVADRLFDKASRAFDLAADALKLARGRGAPDDLVASMDVFMVDAGAWRDKLKELKDSGWQPPAKAEMKELQEGDAVAIAPDHRETYSFIDASAKLVAGKIELTKKGRPARVMLKRPASIDSSQPEQFYGWAPVAHLVRR